MLASRLVQLRLTMVNGWGPSPSVELGSPRPPCLRRRPLPSTPLEGKRGGSGTLREALGSACGRAACRDAVWSPGGPQAATKTMTTARARGGRSSHRYWECSTRSVRLSSIHSAWAKGNGRSKNCAKGCKDDSSCPPPSPRPKKSVSSAPWERKAEWVGAAAPLAWLRWGL